MNPAVEIIGVPMDLGANIRGANMGPAAVRIADLHKKITDLGYDVLDQGDVDVPVRETLSASERNDHFLSSIVKINQKICQRTYKALEAGHIPITIGGDHSLAIGSIAGAAKYFREQGKKIGLIWFDAHADLNTQDTSPSGNIHGMPLAITTGKGHPDLLAVGGASVRVSPKNIALIGIRSLDALERQTCKESGIHCFTMRNIDEKGIMNTVKKAIDWALDGTEGIYVSFDVDGVDPAAAPGVSTPVTGGLSYREAHLALELIADTKKFIGMDLVELNPAVDKNLKTARFAVELIQSVLGKAIL